MAMRKIGTLTIGQAPRSDITPILDAALPAQVSCLHAGVLDGLDDAAIAARFAPQPGDALLTSRLLDGRAVVMGKPAVGEALQQKIDWLEAQGCGIIAILCTGEFHGLSSQKAWLIEPDRILPPTLNALVGERRAGILVPLEAQIASELEKWRGAAQTPVFAVASPYTASEDEIAAAARSLHAQGAEVILTDCMGYTAWHQAICARHVPLPVVLSNKLLADLLGNLL
ncbi:AroM family protein [Kosakonia radicincitans]|uniref:AroM family protein n=1 Tax=Kosakonia radicincitans TaxID=283686 RepID=UPI0005C2F108|nr:AroM family protein [Kosakonia radicincitans]KIS45704.1 aroM family protein [Kosakonia radicincitans YD4]